MNNKIQGKSSLLKSSLLGKITLLILMFLFATTFLKAQQNVTFAQFTQRPINGIITRDFVFTNNGATGSNAGASFQTITGGAPVRFEYSNITGLPAALQGQQNARIIITATTKLAATKSTETPPRDNQSFNQTFTIQIIRDVAAPSGTGSKTNLLTAVITPNGNSEASLAGDDATGSAGFSASTTAQNVTYTSDFITFGTVPTISRNLALAFSSVSPALSISSINNFLNSFTANATGTFASNPLPTAIPEQTAAAGSINGRIRDANGKSAARVVVTLTNILSGETSTTQTNSLGRYSFADLTVAQTYLLSVRSKRFVFEANEKVLTLLEDLSDEDFTALPSGGRIQ